MGKFIRLKEIMGCTPNFIENESKIEVKNDEGCEKKNAFVDLEEGIMGNSVMVETWKEDEDSQVVEDTLFQADNHNSQAVVDPFNIYELFQKDKQPKNLEDDNLSHPMGFTTNISNNLMDNHVCH